MYNAVAHKATNEQRDSYVADPVKLMTMHKLVQKGSRQTRLVSSETQVAPPSTPSPHGSQTGRKKADEQGATEHEVALQSFGAVICFSPTNLKVVQCVCNIISDKVGSQMLHTAIMPLCFKQSGFFSLARLGVSRPIYVNVDSPNLGFPYFNFLGGTSDKNHPV